MTGAYLISRDLYCCWIVWAFLQETPVGFSAILLLLSLFVWVTDALITSRPLSAPKMFPAVLFMVWVLGAAVRRPLQLLSMSALTTALLGDALDSFLRSWNKKLPSARLVSGVIGGVCGAALVPLDWGEKWQQFPLPVAVGLTAGVTFGSLIALLFGLETEK